MRIGIDVDDVVADLLTPWLERLARAVGDGETRPVFTPDMLTQWEIWHDLPGVTREMAWDALTPDIYDEVKPIPGALDAVHAIRSLGHAVVFVTSAQEIHGYQAKLGWLWRHGFTHGAGHEVYGVGPWSPYKTKADPTLDLDWLVDDHIGNLENFPGYRILVTRPHNRRLPWFGKRVKSLNEVVTMLKHHVEDPSGILLDPDAQREYDAMHCALTMTKDNPVEDLKLISCATGETGGACWTEPQGPVGGAVIDAQYEVPFISEQEAAAIHAHNETKPAVRVFSTGATRDTDNGKLDYEGFLSPLVLRSFAEFMHANRYQKDGSLRDSDNWQKGIPLDAYMKSMFRHFMEVWMVHRGLVALDEKGQPVDIVKALNALHFNVQGYQHETLKERAAKSLSDKAA